MADKPKIHTTPVGTAGWVCVTKPSIKFNADGDYSVKVTFSAEDTATLKEMFQAAAEAAKAQIIKEDSKKAGLISRYALHVPGMEEVNPSTGEPTGNVVFNFKQKAVIRPKGKDPFNIKIGVFDAKGKEVPSVTSIGRGTKLKVAYEIWPFKNDANRQVGITLRLKAIQIIELVEYNGGHDAAGYGFGEEDGYTASDNAEATFSGSEVPEQGGETTNAKDF